MSKKQGSCQTSANPFEPIYIPPTPIYWDTDPDVWNYDKVVGQTYWNS